MRIEPRRSRLVSRSVLALASAACVVAISGATICIARPNDQQQQKGVARVVERNGPEVEVHANGQGGQVVVLFPQSANGGNASDAAGDVEVVLVESQMSAAASSGGDNQQQQQQQQPTATGRELLFSSRDASEGIVRYGLDASGNGRRYKVLARVGGEYVQAQQVGGSDGVTVFTVKRPEKPQQQPPQQGEQGGQSQTGQTGGGDQQAQQQQQQQQQPPAPAAIILLYGGAGS